MAEIDDAVRGLGPSPEGAGRSQPGGGAPGPDAGGPRPALRADDRRMVGLLLYGALCFSLGVLCARR